MTFPVNNDCHSEAVTAIAMAALRTPMSLVVTYHINYQALWGGFISARGTGSPTSAQVRSEVGGEGWEWSVEI